MRLHNFTKFGIILSVETERLVTKFLLQNNFPTKINGYHYVKDAIVYVLESQTHFDENKTVFSYLAKKYHTESDNVERCIRTFVAKTWKNLESTGMFTEKPTSREFILKSVEYISLDLLPHSAYDIFDT